MLTPVYNRPDYEPAPAARREEPRPDAAIGYFEGLPFEPVVIRPGVLGLWDRLTARDPKRPALNRCGYCGKPTPGYSWCSVEHSDLWDDDNPW